MASPTMTVDQKNALARAQVNLDVLLANATSAKAQAGRMLRTEGQDYLKLVALAVSLGETLGGLLQTHFHVPVQPSEANLGPNEVALDLANIDARFGLRFGPLPGVAAKSIPQPDYADDSEEAADALIAADDAHVAAMEDPLGARTSGLLAELAALRLAEDVDVTRLRSAISYMAAISGTRFGEQPKFDGALPWSVGPKDTSVSGDIAVPSFTLPWLMACFGNGLALFSDGHFHAAALALDSVLLLLRALIFPDLSLLSLNAEQMPMVDLLRGLTDPVKRRQASVWLEAVLYLRIFALWADTDLAGALSACRDYLSLMHWVSFGSPTSDNSIQCGHAFTLFEENQIGEYPWLYNVPQLDRPLEGTFPQGKFLIPATDPRRLVSVLALFTQLLALSQERGSSDPLPLYAMCLAHALPWLQYISLDFESRHDMWPLSVEQALGILEAGLQLAGPILGLDLMQDFGTAPGCLAPLVTQVALERLQHTGRHSLAEESLQTMTLLAGLRTRTVLSRAAYMSGGSAELRQQADNCRLFFALALLRSNYPLASANELKSAGLLQMELGTSSADQPLTLGSEDSWCSLLQAHILSAALRTAALVHLAQVDAEADAVRLGPATLPPLVPSDPATAEPQYYLATAAGLALGAFHALTRALGRLAPGDAAPAAGRVDLALLRASLAHGAAVCQLHLARGADPAVRLAALALGHRVVATPGDDLPYGGPARQALLASVADLLEEVLPAEIADADQLETVNLADRDGNWLFVIASSLYHLGLAHSEKRDIARAIFFARRAALVCRTSGDLPDAKYPELAVIRRSVWYLLTMLLTTPDAVSLVGLRNDQETNRPMAGGLASAWRACLAAQAACHVDGEHAHPDPVFHFQEAIIEASLACQCSFDGTREEEADQLLRASGQHLKQAFALVAKAKAPGMVKLNAWLVATHVYILLLVAASPGYLEQSSLVSEAQKCLDFISTLVKSAQLDDRTYAARVWLTLSILAVALGQSQRAMEHLSLASSFAPGGNVASVAPALAALVHSMLVPEEGATRIRGTTASPDAGSPELEGIHHGPGDESAASVRLRIRHFAGRLTMSTGAGIDAPFGDIGVARPADAAPKHKASLEAQSSSPIPPSSFISLILGSAASVSTLFPVPVVG